MIRNRPVSLALVGLFLWSTACTAYGESFAWGPEADFSVASLRLEEEEEVRITTVDGEVFHMDYPRLIADDIRGYEDGTPRSIAIDDVDWLESVDRPEEDDGDDELPIWAVLLGIAAVGLLVAVCGEECEEE